MKVGGFGHGLTVFPPSPGGFFLSCRIQRLRRRSLDRPLGRVCPTGAGPGAGEDHRGLLRASDCGEGVGGPGG